MADCNSIESLLNELLSKVNQNNPQRLSNLEQRVAKLERDLAFQTLKNVEQDKNILRINLELFGRGRTSSFGARLQRLEIQMKAQISFTAKLDKVIKRLRNDFTFAVKRFSARFGAITSKFSQIDSKIVAIDAKNKNQDEQLTAIKIAIAGLAALTAKVALLLAKSKSVDAALEALKRLSDQRLKQKGEKGDKGDKGDRGLQGIKGNDGINGRDGRNGTEGQKGSDGIKGRDGRNGTDGQKGRDGINGKDGKNGRDGKDGKQGDQGIEGQVKIVKETVIVEKTRLVDRIVNVYNEPDLSELITKTDAIKESLDSTLSVESFNNCEASTTIETNTLYEFLSEVERKLVLIKNLLCKRYTYSEDNLGDYDHSYSQGLPANFAFLKITILSYPEGFSREFPRFQNEPLLFDFGLATFGNNNGREQSQQIRYEESIFFPINDFVPDFVTIFLNQQGIVYNLTLFIKDT